MTAAIPDNLIRLAEVAEILGITPQRVSALSQSGKIPPHISKVKEAGHWYYLWDRDSVEECHKLREENRSKLNAGLINRQTPLSGSAWKTRLYEAPEGFMRLSDAKKFVGLTSTAFERAIMVGDISSGRRYYPPDASAHQAFQIWSEKELREFLARRKPAPKKAKKVYVPGHALALLERLKRYADKNGFVDGDATDIVTGNPAPASPWSEINRLQKAGMLEWGLDNWDRLTFQLRKEEA